MYGYVQNVTRMSSASITRLLQREMLLPAKKREHHIVSWRKMCGTDGNADGRGKRLKKRAKLAREWRYEVAVLTGDSNKMTVQRQAGWAGINVGCINFTSIYVIDLVVAEQFDMCGSFGKASSDTREGASIGKKGKCKIFDCLRMRASEVYRY